MAARTVSVGPGADTSDRNTRRVGNRRSRFAAREVLWAESDLQRVAYCGRFASGDAVTVKRSADASGAGLGGVQSCGSVWACPVCSEKINAERQAELQRGIENWLAAGHAVLFGTLTLRHNNGHALAELWDAIGPAWTRTTSGARGWNGSKGKGFIDGDKFRFGIQGFVRVVETKHGWVNGWHPHIHFLLFLDKSLTEQQIKDLEARMFGRWEAALAKRGLSVLQSVGIDLRPVHEAALADYFTKGTYTAPSAAAYEVTGSHSKRAGKGGRTPFEVLADVVWDRDHIRKVDGLRIDTRTGEVLDDENLRIWHEWEKASKGRRQLTWSRGLRDLLGLNEEKSDDEIVEEEHDGEIVANLTAGQYRAVAAVPGRLADLLEAAEHPDELHVVRVLGGWGLRDVRPIKRPPRGSLFDL